MSTGADIDNVESYTVAWIAALLHERAAGESMFDIRYAQQPDGFHKNASDPNQYSWGAMGVHKVVIASLPAGEYGANATATIAQGLRSSLPHVRIGLLVGIGAGVPGEESGPDGRLVLKRDIQLGDIAVSVPEGTTGGVVQVDLVKAKVVDGVEVTVRKGSLNSAPLAMRTALAKLQSQHELEDTNIPALLEQAFERYPKMRARYGHPGLGQDPKSDVYHMRDGAAVEREGRRIPELHYGVIASSNTLVKSAQYRDTLLDRLRLETIHPICIEMEAAGLMNSFPCLVIRGICDYADEYKNDDWQRYAAVVAAAYGKDFLGCVDAVEVSKEREIADLLDQVNARVERVEASTTYLEDGQRTKEVQAIVDWVSPFDYSMEQHAKFAQLQPGTGEWFLRDETISAWMSGKVKAVFCPGPPGAGKSVMASLVVHRLQEEKLHERKNAVVKLYCDYGRRDLQDSAHLFSSTLRQLLFRLSGQGAIPHEVVDWYEQCTGRSYKQPTEAESKDMLRIVTKRFVAVFVVIDALDECDSTSRSSLLDFAEGLPALHNFHILLTSRENPEIAGLLAPCHTVPIRATNTDIDEYLRNHLNRLPKFIQNDQDLVARICTRVKDAADGLFLLARLHLHNFQGQTNLQEIEDSLKALPAGGDVYAKTYDAAMKRIEEQPVSQFRLAERVLLWVLNAKRPLLVSELQHALAVKEGQTSLNPKLLPDVEIMLSVCAGLVEAVGRSKTGNGQRVPRDKYGGNAEYVRDYEYDEFSVRHRAVRVKVMNLLSEPVVRFVHHTVDEYFRDTARQRFPDMDRECTIMCLTYVAFLRGPCKTSEEMLERFLIYTWFDYAAHYWSDHFRELEALSGGNLPSVTKAALAFLQNPGVVLATVQAKSLNRHIRIGRRIFADDYEELTSSLHLVAQLGLTGLMQLLVVGMGKEYVNAKNDAGTQGLTALHIAAKEGNEKMVGILLEWGADINTQGGNDRSPLQAASSYGHAAVVRRLLDHDAAVNAQDGSHGNALYAAATFGHEVVVRLLLEHGADVDASYGYWNAPLYSAACYGYEGVVQLLLEHGANANIRDREHTSALQVACRAGHERVVQLLLEHGANANIRDREYTSALQVACREGHETIVRMLLAKGADLNIEGGRLASPLQVACYEGHETIALLLVDYGASLSPYATNRYCKELVAASHQGRFRFAELLLKDGADVNANCVLSNDGKCPSLALQAASSGGHETVVRLLLEHGADVDAQSTKGHTALFLASREGHTAIVRLLLDFGADVSVGQERKRSLSGPLAYGTAFRIARFKRHWEIVRLLVAAGAVSEDKPQALMLTGTSPRFVGSRFLRYQRELFFPEQLEHRVVDTTRLSWEDTSSSIESQISTTGHQGNQKHRKHEDPRQVLDSLRKSGLMGRQRRRLGKKRTVVFRVRNTLHREFRFLELKMFGAFDLALGKEERDKLWRRLLRDDLRPEYKKWFLAWRYRRPKSGQTRRWLRYEST
ncbi:hypothetical protein LTR17_021480 [Elasticomyces elasticus]|nr:hypothetical protein LTR17_021480 [Elasticomyces elasticus]